MVGLGYWGPNLLRVLSESRDAEVKWICDLSEQRLSRFGARYPGVSSSTEIDRVLEDSEVDAVVIATPAATHFDLASRALRAGKHAFVEKPFTPSMQSATELTRIAEREGRVLMCGHTFLYSPPVRAVKALLDRGELGDVFFVSSSREQAPIRRDVSVIWDLGSHDFSILLYWLEEEPHSIRAVGKESVVSGMPDVAFVTLMYRSGLVAHLELSWLAPSKLRRTVLVGSRKMVVYEDGAAEPLRLFDHGFSNGNGSTEPVHLFDHGLPGGNGPFEHGFSNGNGHRPAAGEAPLSYRMGDALVPKLDGREPLAEELADFARAIRWGTGTVANARLANDVVRLMEAADKSLQRGGEEVLVRPRRRFVRARERAGELAGSLGS